MPGPLHLVLEFSRRDGADDPHAFAFGPQVYHLRNPGGDVVAAEFPWSAELLADLVALRAARPDAAAARRVGAALQRFLERTPWAAHEPAILAASRAGDPITVTIRSAAAELYNLPWELLTLRGADLPIGGIAGLGVRYEWPGSSSAADTVAPGHRRGRVLFAWTAAGGAVPAAEHLAALRAHVRGFDDARDVIPHASAAAIAGALARAADERRPIDVLHLLCHGASQGTCHGLALDGDDGAVVVDAGRVQQLLAPHAGGLDAVVLAACDSGDDGDPGNHVGSIAQRIHRAGLRRVVASRFPLSAAGSVRFAAAFYAALADRPFAQAFVAAREALVRDPTGNDWASVQLYARAADDEAPPTVRRGASRRPPVWIAGVVAIVAVAALAVSWIPPPADPAPSTADPAPPPADPAPSTTTIVAPAPITTPDPPAPAKVVDEPSPEAPKAVEPPPPAIDPPPQRRVAPRKPPADGCRPASIPCSADIQDALRAGLGSQPRLDVAVACSGAVTYAPRGDDFAEAVAARARLTRLTGRSPAELPCHVTLPRQ